MLVIDTEALDQLHGEGDGHVVESVLHQLGQVHVVLLQVDQAAADEAVHCIYVVLELVTALDQASADRISWLQCVT